MENRKKEILNELKEGTQIPLSNYAKLINDIEEFLIEENEKKNEEIKKMLINRIASERLIRFNSALIIKILDI